MAAVSFYYESINYFMSDRFKTETKKNQTKNNNKQSCNSMYLSSTLGIIRHILHDCVDKVWKNDENRKNSLTLH